MANNKQATKATKGPEKGHGNGKPSKISADQRAEKARKKVSGGKPNKVTADQMSKKERKRLTKEEERWCGKPVVGASRSPGESKKPNTLSADQTNDVWE